MLLLCLVLTLSPGQDVQPAPDPLPPLERLRTIVAADETADPELERVRDRIAADLELLRSRGWPTTHAALSWFDPWADPPLLAVNVTAQREEEQESLLELRFSVTHELPATLGREGPRPEIPTPMTAQPALEIQLGRTEAIALGLRPAGRAHVMVEHRGPDEAIAFVLRGPRGERGFTLGFEGLASFNGEGEIVWSFDGQLVPHRVVVPLWHAAIRAAGTAELGALLVERSDGGEWRGIVVVNEGPEIWSGAECRALEIRLGAAGHLVTTPSETLRGIRVRRRPDTVRWSARYGEDCELEVHALSWLFCAVGDDRVRPPARIAGRPAALIGGRALGPPPFK